MAVLRFNNGKERTIGFEQSHEIWAILNGDKEPNLEQEKFCANIDRIFLNWRKAPDSYIEKHFDVIAEFHMSEWTCDKSGITCEPDYRVNLKGEYRVWKFARKWGFWDDNGKTELARKYAGEK